jgi:4-alpha-glucanotransferase
MPHKFERNCVVYTGTHDNSTSLGWFKAAPAEDAAMALEYFGITNPRTGNRAFIRAALSSVANLAIVPMQDYLDLNDTARMNTPATTGGKNWCWRMKSGALTGELASRIRRLTRITGR